MPTYLYACCFEDTEEQKSHGEFEEYHSMSSKLEFCPKCKEEGRGDVPVSRLINNTNVGVVQLTGHEYVAKVKSDAQKLKKDVYSNPNTYANFLGEDKYQQVQTQLDKQKKEK